MLWFREWGRLGHLLSLLQSIQTLASKQWWYMQKVYETQTRYLYVKTSSFSLQLLQYQPPQPGHYQHCQLQPSALLEMSWIHYMRQLNSLQKSCDTQLVALVDGEAKIHRKTCTWQEQAVPLEGWQDGLELQWQGSEGFFAGRHLIVSVIRGFLWFAFIWLSQAIGSTNISCET